MAGIDARGLPGTSGVHRAAGAPLTIRGAIPSDAALIDGVVLSAFGERPSQLPRRSNVGAVLGFIARAVVSLEHAAALEVNERRVLATLRESAALSISLVALVGERVVGHIAFSPVTISDGSDDSHALGPLAVAPDMQHNGIGGGLVVAGLDALRERPAGGCVVFGDPAFHSRFGFGRMAGLSYPAAPPECFLGLSFGSSRPRGVVTYDRAFDA